MRFPNVQPKLEEYWIRPPFSSVIGTSSYVLIERASSSHPATEKQSLYIANDFSFPFNLSEQIN